MRGRRVRKLEPIAKLLEKELPSIDSFREAQVFGAFVQALPDRVLANARPVRFHHGTLWVNAKNASWAQELEFLGSELLVRVRARLPKVRLSSIRFRVGPLPDLPEVIRPAKPEPPAMPLASLPEEVGRALASLRDDDVRQAVADAARQSLGRAEATARGRR